MSVFCKGVLSAVILVLSSQLCVAAPAASPSFADLLLKPASAPKASSMESKFEEAQRLQNAGKLDQALKIYLDLDKAAPKNLAVLSNIGIIYRMKNSSRTAKTYFTRALAVSPNNPDVLFHLASISLRLKESAKALEYATKLAKVQPKNFQSQFILGAAYMESGNTAKAKAALKQAHAIRPKDVSVLQSLVQIATQEENYSDVLLYAGKLTQINSKDGMMHMLAAAAAEKLQKQAVAIKHYESASHIAGVQIEALMNLGRLYAVAGQDQKSTNALSRLLKLDKNNYEANMIIAQRLYHTNNLGQAEPFFVAAQKSKPENPDPTIFIALIRVRTNRMEGAFRAAQMALDKAPENRSAMEVYAYVQESQKVYTDANEIYRKWLKLYPEDTIIHTKIASNLISMGNPDEALQEFETALKDHEKDLMLHLAYGDLLLMQDMPEKAYDVFQSALKIKPNQPEALVGSAMCLQKQGKLEDAVSILEKLLTTDTSNEKARMILAGIYRDQDKEDLASEQYKAIIAESPHNMPALLSLVTIYESQKDYEAAIDIYKKLIEVDPKNTVYPANMVKLYGEWGNIDLAIKEAEKLLETDEKNVNFRAMLADLHEKNGDYSAALAEYAELAKSEDVSVKAYALNKSGEIKESQNETNAAIAYFKTALTHVPDYGAALTSLERIHNAQDKQAELQKYVQELVSQAKENSPYPFYYHLMKSAEMTSEAVETLEDISEQNPGIKMLHTTLANAYTELGENEKAIGHYQAILETEPDNARANQRLGQLLIAQSRDKEALKHLEKAASQLTFERQLILDLASTYEKLGDKTKARNTYKDYLKLDPKNQEVKEKIKKLEVLKTE